VVLLAQLVQQQSLELLAGKLVEVHKVALLVVQLVALQEEERQQSQQLQHLVAHPLVHPLVHRLLQQVEVEVEEQQVGQLAVQQVELEALLQ
jgi:hypothetical protein